MNENILNELKELRAGKHIPWTKDTDRELSETFSQLINLGVLKKDRHRVSVNNLKNLNKIIELKSIDKYLDWTSKTEESYKVELNIDNFIGGNNFGIQSSKKDLYNATIEKEINNPISKASDIWSFNNIAFAIITGIIVGVILYFIF